MVKRIVYNQSQLSSPQPKEGNAQRTSRPFIRNSTTSSQQRGNFVMLTHDQLWPSICSLDGRELKTLERGRPFTVEAVDESGVVLSPLVSGKPRMIQRETLEDVFGALLDRRELTGAAIAEEFSRFNAVYVAALLAALPDVAPCTRPTRLIFVGHQLFYLG
jgi:hypothetical protein